MIAEFQNAFEDLKIWVLNLVNHACVDKIVKVFQGVIVGGLFKRQYNLLSLEHCLTVQVLCIDIAALLVHRTAIKQQTISGHLLPVLDQYNITGRENAPRNRIGFVLFEQVDLHSIFLAVQAAAVEIFEQILNYNHDDRKKERDQRARTLIAD